MIKCDSFEWCVYIHIRNASTNSLKCFSQSDVEGHVIKCWKAHENSHPKYSGKKFQYSQGISSPR